MTSTADAKKKAYTDLLEAVFPGDLSRVRAAIACGVEVNEENFEELILCTCNLYKRFVPTTCSNVEIVKLLLNAGGDRALTGCGALIEASRSGDLDVVKLLIEKGADVSRENHKALQNAVYEGHTEIVRVLLENGSDVYVSANDYLIRDAIQRAPIETLKLLFQYGASAKTFSIRDLQWLRGYRLPQVTCFLERAADIIDETTTKKSCKNYFEHLKLSFPNAIKSDAFERFPKHSLSHITTIMLHSAHIASVLGEGNSVQTKVVFTELLANDITRIQISNGLSFRKYSQYLSEGCSGFEDFKDAITEISETLTLPKLVNNAKEFPELHLEAARREAVNLVFPGKSTLDILSLNRRWHRADNRIPLELRPYKRLGEWYPLFDPIKLKDGLTVECLTSPAALEIESCLLKHCVGYGGYTSACQQGYTHIISVRKNGESLATIQIEPGASIKLSNGTSWAVRQFKGLANSAPCSEAVNAWEEAKELLLGNSVKFSLQLGLTEAGKNALSSDLAERITGFPLAESEIYMRKIATHYRERIVVPVKKNKRNRISLIE